MTLKHFKGTNDGEAAFVTMTFPPLTEATEAIAHVQAVYPGFLVEEASDQPFAEAAPTIEQLIAEAKRKVVEYADVAAQQFITGYSEAEQKSWPTQEAEAHVVLAGNGTPATTPLIYHLATDATGQVTEAAVTATATAILAKATAMKSITATLIRIRQGTFNALDACQTANQVDQTLNQALATANLRVLELKSALMGS